MEMLSKITKGDQTNFRMMTMRSQPSGSDLFLKILYQIMYSLVP